MVKSQGVSELRHLKQGYHQMKRQLHHVLRSLKDFQDETSVFHQSVLKGAHVENLENSSDDWVRDKHRLEIELQKCDVTAADLKADIKRYMALNETCQSQISQLKTALSVDATSTTRLPVSTTSVTTPRPQEVKSRILVVPYGSSTQVFRQLNIHSNSLSVYRYLTMKRMTSVAYIEKTRTLLLGSYSPNRISASTLDTSHVTVLREGVRAYGMAVDEDRDIVFIATYLSRYSVSRMSTQGKDSTAIIDLSKYGGFPRQITLDTRRKRIYGCYGGKLETAGVLYYNNEKKLMKMTVSNTVSTEVTTLNVIPYNMRLYRDTIYYGGYSPSTVGAVDVTYNTVAYTLQSISMEGVNNLLLCLIP